MGTAHMGVDPKTSVLNGYNQAHDVPNLFITDGADIASSATQSPSLTYMALSARAAHFAVGFLKAGKSELTRRLKRAQMGLPVNCIVVRMGETDRAFIVDAGF